MTSPSMPTTSVMAVIRLEPSARRDAWIIRSSAEDVMNRIAFSGKLTPVIKIMDSSRVRESLGALA